MHQLSGRFSSFIADDRCCLVSYRTAFVLVDSDGHLVEDPQSHRIVLHHMKENAVNFAQRNLCLSDCSVAPLDGSKWAEFSRDVLYEWKDDREEEDPIMVTFMRQQQQLMHGAELLDAADAGNGTSNSHPNNERWELEQSILSVADEIARLNSSCTAMTRRVTSLEAENVRYEEALAAFARDASKRSSGDVVA